MPFHCPSDVISPKSGLELMYGACSDGCCFIGLKAFTGWLFVLAMVVVDESELVVSKEVFGVFVSLVGDFGLLFWSFEWPFVGERDFVGDLGAFCIGLLLTPGLRYLS